MRAFLRGTYYSGVVVLFLLVALVGFTQTNTFRSFLRDQIITELSEQTGLNIQFDRLDGNLFTRIRTENVFVRSSTEDILQIHKFEVRYNPFSLFLKRFTLSRLTLIDPTIRLTRNNSGVWNIQSLFESTSPDTGTSTWTIDLKEISLVNATVSLVDSIGLAQQRGIDSYDPPAFNYAKLLLEGIHLDLSARIAPDLITARIRNLSAISSHPPFELIRATGEIRSSPTEVGVTNLRIQTAGSAFALSAHLRNLDLSAVDSLDQFKDADIDLSLNADRLSFLELRQFLPREVAFLDRTVSLNASAHGAFSELSVEQVVLTTPNTSIHIVGTIRNLHDPTNLTLDLKSERSVIDPSDLLTYLPGLPLPDLLNFGKIGCTYRFTGLPQNFRATFEGTTEKKGYLTVDASLNVLEHPPSYKATVETREFNIGGVLVTEQIESRLNSRFTIEGAGFDPKDLVVVARGEIDTSIVHGIPFNRSALVLDVADAAGRIRSTIRTHRGDAEFTGRFDWTDPEAPTFSVNAIVNALNLADITHEKKFDSDLYFNITGSGTGFDVDHMQALVKIDFLRSRFSRDVFDRGTARLEYRSLGSPTQRSLEIETDFANLSVNGLFTPASFFGTLVDHSHRFASAIEHRIASLDSVRPHSRSIAGRIPADFDSRPPTDDSLRVDVSLAVVDLHPVGVILGASLEGALRFEGAVERTPSGFSVKGNTTIPYFQVGNNSPSLALSASNLEIDLATGASADPLDSLMSSVTFDSQELNVSGSLFQDVRFHWRGSGMNSTFALSGLLDSLIDCSFGGSTTFAPNHYRIDLPKLSVRLRDFALQNESPLTLLLGTDGLLVPNIVLTDGTVRLSSRGLLNPGGESDLAISLDDFHLQNVVNFSSDQDFVRRFAGMRGVAQVRATLKSTLANPRLELDVRAEDVRMRDTDIGRIVGHGTLDQGVSNLFLELRAQAADVQPQPDLYVSGIMPLFVKTDLADPQRENQQMNLMVKSERFNLQLLDPFVSELSDLTGFARCDVTIGGTLSSPQYSGTLKVSNARFLFAPLNIAYVADGTLVPRGSRIVLEDVTLKNIAADRADGTMNVSGSFALEGIQIKEFDLTANGQLLVMKESSAQSRQGLYGDLFGATGSSGLHWRGTPNLSQLTGDVFIRNANLTLPPARDSYIDRQRSLQLVFINDTTTVVPESVPIPGMEWKPSRGEKQNETAAGSPTKNLSTEEPASRSFLNNIVYNIAIETMGVTQLRIIINQITNEVLFADLKGRLFFNKESDVVRLTGEVEVGSRSFYNYIRQFQASGKLLFTGDPENPELDVLAKYEGYHVIGSATAAVDTARGPVEDERVIVSLDIKGTRKEPKVTMGLTRENLAGNLVESTDIQADAISFLVSGKFRDELTPQERSSLFTTSLAGIGSSILSGPLTEFMRREFGFISSVDVLYYGGNIQGATDVRLTGEIGDAVVKFGGRVFSDISNANINVQIPMSGIFNSERWRNFVFELERRTETFEGFEQRKEINGAKLLYRITF
ncbi:MAG: AsmA family protein [Ignavibacteria bacterium]|nr:AsmA family protein [Ignavibacteria bacterium]